MIDKSEVVKQWKSIYGGYGQDREDWEEVDLSYNPPKGIIKILAKNQGGEFFWCYFDYLTYQYNRDSCQSNSMDYVARGATTYKTIKAAMKFL